MMLKSPVQNLWGKKILKIQQCLGFVWLRLGASLGDFDSLDGGASPSYFDSLDAAELRVSSPQVSPTCHGQTNKQKKIEY